MSNGKGSGIWPFVLGLIAGAVAGILLAPEKGEVSRKKLRRRAAELKDKYSSALDEIKEKTEPVVKKAGAVVGPVFKGIEEVGELAKEELEEVGREEPLSTFDTRQSDFSPQPPAEPEKASPPRPRRLFFRNIH